MSGPWLALVLAVAVIVLTPLSGVLRTPQPVLLAVFGLLLGLVPGVGAPTIEPDLVLPLILPPLLFAATQRTTVREFRERARAVLLLAVGLTFATAAAVAVAAHLAGLGWPEAWVLGAVVSPPDPVAATAVARRLNLPAHLITVLEGEGLFNDATALVVYQVAVATAVTGGFSYGDTALSFTLTVVVGLAFGLAVGFVCRLALGRISQAQVETTITVAAPFLAYAGAERLHGSGVLAVLALGLYLRSVGHQETSSTGWLLGRSVWAYADFLITSLIFAVLGLELVEVMRSAESQTDWELAVVVVLVVVLFRPLWIFPSSLVSRAHARRRDDPVPVGWKETLVVSWSGMRGVVTVATVLALPMTVDSGADFPHRDEVVFAALLCVVVTLLGQGLTLGPLTTTLGVADEESAGQQAAEVHDLRRRAAEAALEHVRGTDEASAETRRAVELQYEGLLQAQEAMRDVRSSTTSGEHDPTAELEDLLRRTTQIERHLVLDARRLGEVSAGSADEALRDIERRAMRDLE